MMNNGLSHGSATIYQFPVGGRAALGGRRYGETRLPADHASLPADVSICSDSWYRGLRIQAQMGTLIMPPRSLEPGADIQKGSKQRCFDPF